MGHDPDTEHLGEEEATEERSENIYLLLRQLPLFDELYLGMQAMNVGLVDGHVEGMEQSLWELHMEMESTPVPEAMLVSALSQMWIFALYELLRTWRQRTKELVRYATELHSADEPQRRQLTARMKKQLKEAGMFAIGGAYIHENAFERVEKSDDMLNKLKAALDGLEPVFRKLEFVRVTLAKHEIPKTKGLLASAPGYGRIGTMTGSTTWQVILKDGSLKMISRRDIADDLRKACRAIIGASGT
jgi:prepilin-type processing-associated H-X9-DG protein